MRQIPPKLQYQCFVLRIKVSVIHTNTYLIDNFCMIYTLQLFKGCLVSMLAGILFHILTPSYVMLF